MNTQRVRSTRPTEQDGERVRSLGGVIRWFPMACALLLFASIASGQEPVHPLKPPDRSSPRATLKTFLDSADGLAAFLAREYVPSPTRQGAERLRSLSEVPIRCLDLSGVPPAARVTVGRAVAALLYETVSRIELPPLSEVPDAGSFDESGAARWTIPNTEITLTRVESGLRSGEFLFSAETVARASEFYDRVRPRPYVRPIPFTGIRDLFVAGGGWLIPFEWVQAMPEWLRSPVGGQSAWKWIALALVLIVFVLLIRFVHRLSLRASGERPFLQALAQLALPAFILAATPIVTYLALVQINLPGAAGSATEFAATAVMYVAGAWLSWRAAPVVAEAIIASPHIPSERIDALPTRIVLRLLGIVGGAWSLAVGAERLGLPVYGIIAGLGVGGVALALAAQPTIENLIGGFSLFADKPVRVGDFCQYGDALGTVEAIGFRSTRLRGIDRTLTTIPNAALSKMPIVSYAERDRMLIRTVIGVRYETSPEQLRYILTKLREMLLGHPRIHPDPARVRFVGFGASSQNIEMFAYAVTRDWGEFLGIQEDVLLRVIDVVQQSGSGFAFPSQTLYFARDGGLNADRTQAAEAHVRQWRQDGCLPFPEFSPEQARRIRGILVYPPPGSPESSSADPGGVTDSRTAPVS
jgi:MscS family membrane protein